MKTIHRNLPMASVPATENIPKHPNIHLQPERIKRNTSVHAFIVSDDQANRILDSLGKSGFASNRVSVLFSGNDSTRGISIERNIKFLEGAMISATSGGILGGIVGLLVGIGTTVVPDAGQLVAAGSMLSVLCGASAGATAGGIAGALFGFRIPGVVARLHQNRFTDGNILLSVHTETEDEVRRARHVLKKGFAEDISATSTGDPASRFDN